MADQPQTIVEPAASDDKPYGSRNDINLRASFSGSPIYASEVNDDERKEVFQELALDGTVVGGLGINSFDRDFNGAPNLADVETGGGGKPASPYVPNLSSPGPGSVFPADQPEYTGELPDGSAPEFGSGLGGTTSPSKTSENIADQKLGDYISGRSYQGSDGRS